MAIACPKPGPMPDTTTTRSLSNIWSTHHSCGDTRLARGNSSGVIVGTARLVEGKPLRDFLDRHHFHGRAVGGGELAGKPLPPDLHVTATVPQTLKPVGHPGVALADDEAQ